MQPFPLSIDGSEVGTDESGGVDGEEIEGIAIGHLVNGNGAQSWVHVLALDNDITKKDDVFLKHFAVPNPGNL